MRLKVLLWTAIALVVMAMTSLVLIRYRYVDGMIERERTANYAFLGRATAKAVENRAEVWYQKMFVDTKLVQATMSTTGGNDINIKSDNRAVNDAKKAGSTILEWWDERIRVIWAATYQLLMRISMLLLWLPLAILAIIPVVVDSVVSRRIKATSFALTSPHMQMLGSRSIFWICFAYFVLMLVPIMLHPIMAPLVIGLVSGCMWLGISQFAKRA